MKTFQHWLSRGLTLLALGFMCVVLARSYLAGASDAPRPTDIAAAQRVSVSRDGADDFRAQVTPRGAISGQGIIEPNDRESKVGAPVAGVIAHIFVKEGDLVKVGDRLVELQDDVEKAAVAAAQAQVERARSGQRIEDQHALSGDAASASARGKLSQINAKRIHQLFEKGAATQDDDDKARYQAEIDEAAALAATSRADLSKSGWKLDATVAEAQLKQAEAQLAQLTVRAPIDGTVLQLVVREGEFYAVAGQTSTPLVTLGDLSKIRARLDIDERDVGAVQLGQRGYVTAEAFGDRRFEGHVVEVARRMGRKNLRSDEPTERIDTKIREVVLELDSGQELVQGLRVTGSLGAGAVAKL